MIRPQYRRTEEVQLPPRDGLGKMLLKRSSSFKQCRLDGQRRGKPIAALEAQSCLQRPRPLCLRGSLQLSPNG